MGSDATNGVQPWVSDGTAAGTHILMTNGANLAPVAANDAAISTDDAAVTINVIANDTDSGGTIDPTSVQIVSQPAHGTTSTTSTVQWCIRRQRDTRGPIRLLIPLRTVKVPYQTLRQLP
jgi:hypothetical protein